MLFKFLDYVFRSGNRQARTDQMPGGQAVKVPPVQDELDKLIDYAAGEVSDNLPPDLLQRVINLAQEIDQQISAEKANLNVFVFHVRMGDEGKVRYRDVAMDVSKFDYGAVLELFKYCARRWHPDASVFLLTDKDSGFEHLQSPGFSVIKLNLAGRMPMYERVVAMCAYARSKAFNADTLFLDSDAFLNANFSPYLEGDYDIAVTHRDIKGLMPINEGVIVARAARQNVVRQFFDRYLSTYARLADDERVTSYYGDIRKWRGGQLTLNAITRDASPYSYYRELSLGGVRVKSMPCDPFNYSYEYGQQVEQGVLKSKVVIHLKGGRKKSLEAFREIAIASTSVQASMSPRNVSYEDRRYSLDTTHPMDYVPDGGLDYRGASLTEIADYFKTDKGTIKHGYTFVYARYLEDLRGQSVRVLEVGVACGSSLKMWSAYFGESSHVTGVDIREECRNLCAGFSNIDIRIADAANIQIDADVFDLIVDDGSHVSKDIVETWRNLWPGLKSGGYYIIEDMRCTHDEAYKRGFTFQKDADAFDRKHFVSWLDMQLREMDYSQSEIDFIHIYRQMVVIRKKD